MGQQQLLLMVLGVVLVGISIVVGINMFKSSMVEANRDAVLSDLTHLANLALQYYNKPTNLGGGGKSFRGFTIPQGLLTNDNGTYRISRAGNRNQIRFQGDGTEKGNNNRTAIRHRVIVRADGLTYRKIN